MEPLAKQSNVIELKTDRLSLSHIIDEGVTVSRDSATGEVLDMLFDNPNLRIIPVISNEIPVGLVSRQTMIEIFSRPFRRELFGKQPIHHFMDNNPIIVEDNMGLDEVANTLVSVGFKQMLDGFIVVDSQGRFVGTGNAQDLLGEVTKRKQAYLHKLAHYDSLTELPNRQMFNDRLSSALQQASMSGKRVAVVFLDIDHFKRINDSLGHMAGDELLKQISRRFEDAIRSCDTIARMGGDEFTLLISELNHIEDASSVVDKIRARLREPFSLAEQDTVVTASIGIAVYPDDGTEMDILTRKADNALYDAKSAGRDTYRFFDNTHDLYDESRFFLEQELRTAIERHQIEPYFQAIVDARSGDIIGAEALARWQHPEHGFIPPEQFVSLAEDVGLIKQLSRLMSKRSLSIVGQHGLEKFKMSLNVSVRDLNSRSFVRSFFSLVDEIGFPPEMIQLEITERMFLEPSSELLHKLNRIRERGTLIAVDDFGVGSTSLRLLHKLPIDVLKIDKSFISGEENAKSDALVKAVIDMGHALDLSIVAEGVETDEQRSKLTYFGCDQLQGFLFGKPQSASSFIEQFEQTL